MKPCIYAHSGPITTLYGVTPTDVKNLPTTCAACGEGLVYAESVYFVSAPYQQEYTDQDGNVIMTGEPLF